MLLALLPVLAFGAWLRLRGIGDVPLFGDEFHTLVLCTKPWLEIFLLFDKVGSHVPLPLLQKLSQELFGPGLTVYRLPALVPGLLTLLLVHPVLRPFAGGGGGSATAAVVAVHPMLVYYTRFSRAYALMVFLGLLYLGLVGLGVRRRSFAGRVGWGTAVVSGLLPWVHLSSLGFVLAVGTVGILLVTRGDRSPRSLWKAAWPFVAGASLCALLYLPVVGHVLKYTDRVTEEEQARPQGPVEVATVLAGARWAGWGLLAAVPVGFLVLRRRRPEAALLLGAALAGPLAFLLASRPHGMAFAWGRYLIVGLPAGLLLAVCAVEGLLRRLRAPRLPLATAAAGLLLAGALHATGPLAPWRPQGEPYTNTYLALKSLSAFDEPWPAPAGLWQRLRAERDVHTIIEALPLFSRAVHLYRNQALQHGKRVLIGWSGEFLATLRNGPYVDLASRESILGSGADRIVLHLDVERELEEYWRFVYEDAWPRVGDPSDAGFMERSKTYYLTSSRVRTAFPATRPWPTYASLVSLLGDPYYRDEYVAAWRLPARPADRTKRSGR